MASRLGSVLPLLLVLLATTSRSAAAAELTVNKVMLQLKALKKTDAFLVAGTATGLSLDAGQTIELAIGNRAQTLPLTSFKPRGAKLVFRARKAAQGITRMTI